MENGSPRPLEPGTPAPDFRLPAVDREGTVGLSDFRGTPLLLALFLGLWCPFCRKQIAGLAKTATRLKGRGVETLAVVATPPENARLYFRFRPVSIALAADPELVTHRLFGLPRQEVTPEFVEQLQTVRSNPTGELPEPVPFWEIGGHLDRVHGYQRSPADQADLDQQFGLFRGQFLLDGEGIVRWSNIECAREGVPGIGRFPSDDDLLEAVRGLEEAAGSSS